MGTWLQTASSADTTLMRESYLKGLALLTGNIQSNTSRKKTKLARLAGDYGQESSLRRGIGGPENDLIELKQRSRWVGLNF